MNSREKLRQKIGEFREKRKKFQTRIKNLTVVKKSDKVNEFIKFVDNESIDLICLSESWERENKRLEEIINIENFSIISNVFARKEIGGRPAIIVNNKKYDIENLTQSVISIPWGVEAVWAVLTPKNSNRSSKIQKIVIGSIYCKPDSRRKTLLLDHIAGVFHTMSSKYAKGLHWIICGDTNKLKLDPILHLSSKLHQVVKEPTRLNPPEILDPTITTLASLYQVPECLPPLDNDPENNGKPADHLMVKWTPISSIDNESARLKKIIIYRPYADKSLNKMQEWIDQQDWSEIKNEKSAHDKMKSLQNLLIKKYEEFFPERKKIITIDDQPFFSNKLKIMKRRKAREFRKNRKSNKWLQMDKAYKLEVGKAKKKYYSEKIEKLANSKPKFWYRELKKLTGFDQDKFEKVNVEEIRNLPSNQQAELIADKFASVSQEYEALKREDIVIPPFNESDIPIISTDQVVEALKNMDVSKSSVKGDIPSKVLKHFADQIAVPMTEVINTSIKQGCWPDIFKLEIVTPVPKVPKPKTLTELRNISGLLNLSKITEKIIAKMIIADMKGLDPSQFGNQEGISIQHYLIKLIDRVLEATDKKTKNGSVAVLATLVDWKEAFSRQCPKLGIESFIENGVRPALIPMLINFFQGRQMKVKWHGVLSKERELRGGGPQGSTFGIWEYLSQSNDSAQSVDLDDRYKFVDDLTFLEVIQLLNIGLASYNIKSHVPSNIGVHNQIIPSKNLKSQQHLNLINDWTKKKKMRLNENKTKNIIFNFTKKYQFTTDISVNNKNIDIVKETKLLGTYITNDLKWDKNTSEIVKKSNQRMQLLNRAAGFTSNIHNLKRIYLTYILSLLDQSAVVWHSSLSKKNIRDLERIQKVAVKVILGKSYLDYNDGLEKLRLQRLNIRREKICLNFAKKCLKNEKVKHFFKENKNLHRMNIKSKKKFKERMSKTKRFEQSAIPYMTKLLNNEYKNKKKIMMTT